MKMKNIFERALVLFALSFSLQGEALAQRAEAFCALRDPNREIRLLSPKYESFDSIIRKISQEERVKILKEVPFPIHFDELGQHTLYVVRGKEEVSGYVHVRSEPFSWGLVRIAWMMDTNLDVTGFRFQRCRSPHRAELESEAILSQFSDKSIRELSLLLTPDGERLSSERFKVSEGAEELASLLIRSAIKTRVVTGIVWESEFTTYKALELSQEHFGKGASVTKMHDNYDAVDQRELVGQGLKNSIGFARSEVRSWSFKHKGKGDLGEVFYTPWAGGEERARLLWVLDSKGRVLAVDDPQRSLSAKSTKLFQQLVGRSFTGDEECTTASELAALELSLLHRSR